MTYTIRDKNGLRVVNPEVEGVISVNVPLLLEEIGFNADTTRIDCKAHEKDLKFLAQWVSEKKLLVVEYNDIIRTYEPNTNQTALELFQGILDFVREVYGEGKE